MRPRPDTPRAVDPDGAVRKAHEWFEHNSGWAPPDDETLAEWLADGVCRCPDECLVPPSAWCDHGLASWWLIIRALDERAVRDHFGLHADALIGEGSEARVFALEPDLVVRLPNPGSSARALQARRQLLATIAGCGVVPLPEVVEHRVIGGRLVVVERRLPGRSALDVLAEPGTDRAVLVVHHLDVAASIAALPCPTDRFGELWGDGADRADSFETWATGRLDTCLRRAASRWAHLAAQELTEDLLAVLPDPEPTTPHLVHLDAYLGNMLAQGSRITGLLDFGPATLGGPPHLDPLAAIAYLAPEITPTATAQDRVVARDWAEERGLAQAIGPAERWLAAYWTSAVDDGTLQAWCARILG